MSQHLTFSCIAILYTPNRNTLFDKLKEIVTNLQELSDQNIIEILLYGAALVSITFKTA